MNEETIKQAEDAISVAIMKLMMNKTIAFDVSVICNLKREFTEDPDVIAGVNATTLLINPKRFLAMSINDQQFVLRHEAWHVIGFDSIRAKDKDALIWNQACDYWINLMIADDPNSKLIVPSGCLIDRQYTNWDKEEIYANLIANRKRHKKDLLGNDLRDPDSGSSDESNTLCDERNKAQKEIESIITTSAIQAISAGGVIPESVKTYLNNLYNPKLNWNQILIRYMDSYAKHDYSYKRINHKYLDHGFILPTCYSEAMGEIYIATDSSISVSDAEYSLYAGAIMDIKTRCEPEKLVVLSFTTEVIDNIVIESSKDIDRIRSRDYGGTHIPCVFKYIDRNKIKPQVLIVFSDMLSKLPLKPSYDVIWVCVDNPNWKPPSYGRVIYVNT